MNLLRAMIAPLARGKRFFAKVAISGSHRQSLQMIAAGSADLAAIDCVTWALLHRIEPALVATTRVLAWSAPSPGLLITSAHTDLLTLAALRAVLDEIANDAALSHLRAELLLSGFKVLPHEDYGRVRSFEADAIALGYPQLA
jgi:ABC-type phosphate/phosphonate transport system substrate-binding protein